MLNWTQLDFNRNFTTIVMWSLFYCMYRGRQKIRVIILSTCNKKKNVYFVLDDLSVFLFRFLNNFLFYQFFSAIYYFERVKIIIQMRYCSFVIEIKILSEVLTVRLLLTDLKGCVYLFFREIVIYCNFLWIFVLWWFFVVVAECWQMEFLFSDFVLFYGSLNTEGDPYSDVDRTSMLRGQTFIEIHRLNVGSIKDSIKAVSFNYIF